MQNQKLWHNWLFWAVVCIIVVTIAISIANYSELIETHIRIGPLFVHHWMSWSGALFIAIATPLFSYLKRRQPDKYRSLINFHVLGNLSAFLLISVHFSHQLSRHENFPSLGTGLALFIAVLMLVTTGILQKFNIGTSFAKNYRPVHIGATTTFYTIIVIHILHGVGVI